MEVLLLFALALGAGALLVAPAPPASALTTVPTKMNFQGRLTDNAGNVKANGSYNMRLKLYAVNSGGSAVWSEDRLVSAGQGIPVTNGLFSLQLGSLTPLPASLFASGSLYLEVELASPATATSATPTWSEGPMTPRNQLATSAYAYNAETLDGLDSSDFAAASGSSSYIQNGTSPQTASLNITGSAAVGGDTLVKTTTNSTTAFSVQSATGLRVLQVDTLNKQVTVGPASSSPLPSTWGGAGSDYGYALVQTSDGGYAVTGRTGSYSAGGQDMFLAKYDAAGTLSWSRTWGGTEAEHGTSLVQTSDGGYAVTGHTASYGAGSNDLFLVKYDAAGTLSWSRTWGGTSNDVSFSLVQTSDGGYAMTGRTLSYGVGGDLFLVKYDATGTLSWSRTWGGTGFEYGYALVQASDGGYAIAGYNNSYGAGGNDAIIVKYDSAGTLSWARTWGGTGFDQANSLVQTSDGGYAMAGQTGSYGAGSFDTFIAKYDSAGTLSWSRTWGGTGGDYGTSLVQTSDGGYAMTGYTNGYGAGSDDALLIKYDATGTPSWARTWGGTGVDQGTSLVQTSDGGYAIAGDTYSYGAGSDDALLIKYDAMGDIAGCTAPACQAPAGSTASPTATSTSPAATMLSPAASSSSPAASTSSPTLTAESVGQTAAPTLRVTGNTALSGTLSVGTPPAQLASASLQVFSASTAQAAFAVQQYTKNPSEQTTFAKAWGRTSSDQGYSLIQTSDGGYALTGGVGVNDMFLAKYDVSGTLSWSRIWGGAGTENGNSIVQTSDGGYVVTGTTNSYGAGGNDMFLAKYDATGTLSWSRTWGGAGTEYGDSIVQTNDGGYAVAGYTNSYGAGGYDAFLVKYDSSGTLSWSRTWGGTGREESYSLVQTSDGGYAVTGNTTSYGAGAADMFLAKYDSAGTLSWSRTWGGSGADYGRSLVNTSSDGGFAVAGYTVSYGAGGNETFLAKYDSAGTLSWSRTWGGTSNELGYSLVQTSDGGYALTGQTRSYGAGDVDMFLAKYDASGTLSWNRTWGGTNSEIGYSLIQTSDGGYAVAGETLSYGVNGDAFLLKYDANGAMAGCDQSTCQSPSAAVSSPAASTSSPAASTSSPAASTSSPAATVTSPAITDRSVIAVVYGGGMQGTTSLLVDASGNVGIGTTVPGAKLQVAGDTLITVTSSTALRVQDAAGTTQFGVDTANKTITIGSATPDDSAVLLVIDSYNSPTDPAGVNGAMYYNTALGSFRCYENNAWRSCVGGLAAANTTTTGNTVASTTAETNFASSYTLPANACQPGRVLKVTANGVYGTAGTAPTLNIRVKAGTTNLGATGAQATTISMANRRWSVEFYVTCLTSGTTGTVEAHGSLTRHTSAVAAVDWEMTNTAPVTLNTTTSQAIQLSAQWGTANASNTITLRQLVVESIGP